MHITAKNEFYDPSNVDAEVFGFYEEFITEDAGSGYGYKWLGTRRLEGLPTRPIGADGRISVVFTEDITLDKGHKKVLVRASKKRPVRAYAMIQMLQGRTLKK